MDQDGIGEYVVIPRRAKHRTVLDYCKNAVRANLHRITRNFLSDLWSDDTYISAIRQGTIRITSVSQFSFDLAYKAVLLILVSYFVLPRLVDVLTRRGSVWWCLFKIFIANEVIEGFYFALKLTVVYTGLLSFRDDLVPVWHGSSTLNIVVDAFLLPLEFLAMQIRAVFVLSFAWLLLVLALMLLLRVLQFLVFRIATYDKGPVLAISALMTAFGAILKFFVVSGAPKV
jgi:hypothetical protein